MNNSTETSKINYLENLQEELNLINEEFSESYYVQQCFEDEKLFILYNKNGRISEEMDVYAAIYFILGMKRVLTDYHYHKS